MCDVHVGDGGGDLGEDGEGFVFDEEVVGVDQEADAGVRDLVGEAGDP